MVEMVRFVERCVKQGEIHVGNWRADLNELMARNARVRVVSCFSWREFVGSKPWEALWCACYSIAFAWRVCLICTMAKRKGLE